MRSVDRFRFGEFVVDPSQNTLTHAEQITHVPPRVMDVLVHLIENNERVVATDELLDEFWAGRVVEESTLHRVVNQIRKHLGDSARDPQYVRTISKRGYQAIATVAPVDEAEPTGDAPTPERSGSWSGSWLAAAAGIALLLAISLGIAVLSGDQSAPSEPAVAEERLRLRDQFSVAVLPIVNLSADEELRFFADGLADGVLDVLAQNRYLKVASRTETFELASSNDLSRIGDELKVAYVVEGSVQASGDSIR